MTSHSDIKLCRDWAELYRLRGLNPLPSRPDAKRPCCRYAQYWDAPAPAELFERFPTSNIQIVCGRAWRLLVIDLDGEEAISRWQGMGRSPRTWVSHSGGGGRHLWFRLPADMPKPIGKAIVWESELRKDVTKWNKANPDKLLPVPHEAIERLCDQSLVMAPPSIHPVTGQRYRFLSKGQSPMGLGMPADCPDWVLRLRPADAGKPNFKTASTLVRPVAAQSPSRFSRTEVLEAIPDKLALARQWGVRLAGRPNAKGWAPCHAIDREDVHASAAIHKESGSYVDHGSGVKLSLFDLGAQLGVYSDWKEAIQQLGSQHA